MKISEAVNYIRDMIFRYKDEGYTGTIELRISFNTGGIQKMVVHKIFEACC